MTFAQNWRWVVWGAVIAGLVQIAHSKTGAQLKGIKLRIDPNRNLRRNTTLVKSRVVYICLHD